MKIFSPALFLLLSVSALATTPAQYGQYIQDNWVCIKEEALLNKKPIPSKAAYEQMTQRDENSINYNGGKIVRYPNGNIVYYDYSDDKVTNSVYQYRH